MIVNEYKPNHEELMKDLLTGKRMRCVSWNKDSYIKLDDGFIIDNDELDYSVILETADGREAWEEYQPEEKKPDAASNITWNKYPEIKPTEASLLKYFLVAYRTPLGMWLGMARYSKENMVWYVDVQQNTSFAMPCEVVAWAKINLPGI